MFIDMEDFIAKRKRRIDWKLLQEQAAELQEPCRLCIRRCGARRQSGEAGFCGVRKPLVSKSFITYGEEPQLNPAYMLYFAGCNLRCAYCSNREFLEPEPPGCREPDVARIAAEADEAYRTDRIRVLQMLGGEPACSLAAAVETAFRLESGVPVVWNSDFLFTEEAFRVIDAFADFYVADYKFFSPDCSFRLAGLRGYAEAVEANLLRVDPDRLIIRQLPVHGHVRCCTVPVLEWIARHLPQAPVTLNDLLPDAAGRCLPLDAEERQLVEETVERLRLKRLFPVWNRKIPGGAAGMFSGELIVRPDGSVAVQDLAGPVRELLEKLGLELREDCRYGDAGGQLR